MPGTSVTVRVGVERYALDAQHVSEVAELGRPTPVPGAPAMVLGIRNVHGQLVPVLSLGSLLGIDGGDDPARLVIAGEGALRAGLAVDEVLAVEAAPEPTEPTDSPLLHGAALIDGVLVGLVDVPALLKAAGAAA